MLPFPHWVRKWVNDNLTKPVGATDNWRNINMWKIIGAILGFLWLGYTGLFLGLFAGYLIDRSRQPGGLKFNVSSGNRRQQQEVFFQTLFLLMGRLAKADGHVSNAEIQIAQAIMDRMRLPPLAQSMAKKLFNEGKSANFDLVGVLNHFQTTMGPKSLLTQQLIEILLVSAYADGHFSLEEKSLVSQVCAHLGISVAEFEALHIQIKQQAQFNRGHGAEEASPKELLKAAYQALGVTQEMSDGEIKKAYRKLMSQHHPDKLMSQGLPDEMVTIAKERTQQIQSAYELIKKHRKG